MLSLASSARGFITYGAVGVAIFSFFMSALEYHELKKYEALEALDPVVIDGNWQISKKTLFIYKRDQVLAQCSVAACGFPGIYSYAGMDLEAHFKGSAITRILVNGATIDTFAMETNRRGMSLKKDLWTFFVSTLVILTLRILPSKAPNPALQRTASGGR